MKIILYIYHLIVDNKIPSIAGSLCFFLLLNGGSFFFLFINIASYFLKDIEEVIDEYLEFDLLKMLLIYLIEHNINLKYSIFLIISSIYSSSTLYYHFLNGIELLTNNQIKFKRSKRLFSLILVILFLFIIFVLVFLSSIIKVVLDSFLSFNYLIIVFLMQLFLIGSLNIIALKTIRIRFLFKGITFSLLYFFVFTIGFLLYLEIFSSFKIVYGVLSFFIILLFYLYILMIGLLIGIYYNWYNLTKYVCIVR